MPKGSGGDNETAMSDSSQLLFAADKNLSSFCVKKLNLKTCHSWTIVVFREKSVCVCRENLWHFLYFHLCSNLYALMWHSGRRIQTHWGESGNYKYIILLFYVLAFPCVFHSIQGSLQKQASLRFLQYRSVRGTHRTLSSPDIVFPSAIWPGLCFHSSRGQCSSCHLTVADSTFHTVSQCAFMRFITRFPTSIQHPVVDQSSSHWVRKGQRPGCWSSWSGKKAGTGSFTVLWDKWFWPSCLPLPLYSSKMAHGGR